MQDTPIVPISDIDKILSEYDIARIQQGRKYYRDKDGNKIYYLNVITSFDIETSKHDFSDTDLPDWQAWLYLWSFQIGSRATIIGRTWEEFVALVYLINQHLERRGENIRLLCYVHELSYEFQFLAGYFDFKSEDVMVMDERIPLICYINRLEMRCSKKLANFSLAEWCHALATDHQKIRGYDYDTERYPWTPLTDEEIRYCITDTICVVECVYKLMDMYGDTIYTIPYTATGYIRRKIKSALVYWSYSGIQSMQNDYRTYKRLTEAFRGGDSYESYLYHGCILDDVDMYDISSSYPAIALHCLVPMSVFVDEKPNIQAVKAALERKRCVLMRVGFRNIKIKPEYEFTPYITYNQCKKNCLTRPIDAEVGDNGRLYSASYCEMAITDVDLEIIDRIYDYGGDPIIYWAMSARYGYIPQPLADIIIKLYRDKTALKGVSGREPEYIHIKRELNAGCFGIMAQRMCDDKKIVFEDGEWKRDPNYDEEAEYNERSKKAYVNYAWSVWITAIGRRRFLFDGCLRALSISSDTFVYGDTDSVISREPIDFEKYNRERMREAKASGAYADDINGVRHYIGCFEHEGCGMFRTLGVKKYITEINNKIEISVSGIPKEQGSKIIEASANGIMDFDEGFVFKGSGKKTVDYNDDIDDYIEMDGHMLHITRNAAIIDVDYTMQRPLEYERLMEFFYRVIDDDEIV